MANRFINKLCGFAELTQDELQALEIVTRSPRAVGPRKDLIREGDQPGPVFVILEGWAFRYKVLPNGSRQIMAFLMPGDACDLHIGMLAEMDHSLQTTTDAQVATISRQAMDEMMGTYPGIARAMYIAQLVDEGTLRAWIVSLGRRNSGERAAHLPARTLHACRSHRRCEPRPNGAAAVPSRAGGCARHDARAHQPDASGASPIWCDRAAAGLIADHRPGGIDEILGVRRELPA